MSSRIRGARSTASLRILGLPELSERLRPPAQLVQLAVDLVEARRLALRADALGAYLVVAGRITPRVFVYVGVVIPAAAAPAAGSEDG